jgi:hypothetical protein
MKAPDDCCDAQLVEVYSPKKGRQFSNPLTSMDSAGREASQSARDSRGCTIVSALGPVSDRWRLSHSVCSRARG